MNWGIIGLGKIAHKFAQDLQQTPNARLWAVASTDHARAAAFAERYDVPNAFGSYAEMATCPDIDAVYIATPHSLHHECALLCLTAEIPVLCEKPMAMSRAEVAEMIAVAQAYDTFLMEAIWTRFLPHTIKMLDMVQQGMIGDIISIQADFGYRMNFDAQHRIFNRKLGGGALYDVGIYPVFLTQLLLGKPNKMEAIAQIGTTGVDETCAMILQFPNGAIANLYAAITTKTPTMAHIYGTKGNIVIEGRFHEPNEGFTVQLHGREAIFHPFETDCLGYRFEAEEVMRCLASGVKESPLLPLSFSLELAETLEKIAQKMGYY